MNVQAALFDLNNGSTEQSRKWLYTHYHTPLKKGDETGAFLRYRFIEPNYSKYKYRIKTIQKSPLIKFILQYNKNEATKNKSKRY